MCSRQLYTYSLFCNYRSFFPFHFLPITFPSPPIIIFNFFFLTFHSSLILSLPFFLHLLTLAFLLCLSLSFHFIYFFLIFIPSLYFLIPAPISCVSCLITYPSISLFFTHRHSPILFLPFSINLCIPSHTFFFLPSSSLLLISADT